MKRIKNLLGGVFVVILLNFAYAQPIAAPIWSTSTSDLAVMLQAVEATTPVAAESVPGANAYYSAQNPTWPPLPGNINNVPVWSLGDGAVLLDDLDINYSQQPLNSSMMAGGMSAMDVPSPGDGGDGGTNSYKSNGSSFVPPDYGTNLWIAQVDMVSGNLTGVLSNSQADVEYEIQSLTDLTQAGADWNSECFILGSELTNWTPMSVAQNGRTNLFLRIRSWKDSYDLGIPDWWQLQYFGYIGIDPYADPAGDGYSNLYKYQHGLNPFTFYAPQFPVASAIPTVNDSGTTISWDQAQGAVINYTIYRNGSAIATVPASQLSYPDTSVSLDLTDPNDADFPTYQVQANYSGSEYLGGAQQPINPRFTIATEIVRGPGWPTHSLGAQHSQWRHRHPPLRPVR